MTGARIGADCSVGDHAFIESGACSEAASPSRTAGLGQGHHPGQVFLGPNMVFTNDMFPRSGQKAATTPPTLVRHGATIGANATIAAASPSASPPSSAPARCDPRRPRPRHGGRQPAHFHGWICAAAALDATLTCDCSALPATRFNHRPRINRLAPPKQPRIATSVERDRELTSMSYRPPMNEGVARDRYMPPHAPIERRPVDESAQVRLSPNGTRSGTLHLLFLCA
jgi:hypothetical protein